MNSSLISSPTKIYVPPKIIAEITNTRNNEEILLIKNIFADKTKIAARPTMGEAVS